MSNVKLSKGKNKLDSYTHEPSAVILKNDQCVNNFFVICLHFDSLIDILTNATSSSGMSL
jgi:hypothetical protein